MDVSNTYFELIPKELYYIILSKLEMRDICYTFGYNFYSYDRIFFDIIINRDFGGNIITNLINTDRLDVMLKLITKYGETCYEKFVRRFNSLFIDINKLKDKEQIKLQSSFFNIEELEKLGLKPHLEGDEFIVKVLYIRRLQNDWYIFPLYDNVNSPGNISITLDQLVNLIFFFHIDTIFEMVSSK